MKDVKRISRKFWFGALAFAGLALILSGCLNDDDNEPTVPVALVSLYQGSPDAPALDIEVDNRQLNLYEFNYADFTGYLRFYTGDRNLRFGPFGASNIVIDTTVTFEKNKVYSVFVADEYNNAGIVVLNDNSDLPASGKIKVRVINLSPDSPDIDLAIAGETGTVANDLTFKEASGFTEIDADEYDFQIRASSDDEVLLTMPDINLQPRYFYTIIIRGYQTPPLGNTSVLSAQVVVN